MTDSIPVTVTVEVQLDQELAQLQQSASMVADQLRASGKAHYKHLAELYMWWRLASTIDGYLADAYSKAGKKYKKKVKHGINFAPLFWLAWGYNNDLTDDKCRRWSIVLNKFDALYNAEAQYRTDSVAKLQNFLNTNGGVDGVVTEGGAADDEGDDERDEEDLSDDEVEAMPTREAPLLDVNTMLAQLYDKARAFYSAVPAPATIDLDYTLPTTDDGMGLLLVRKIGEKYQLVGASSDETMVRPLAMHTYLHDFTALPLSIRAIIETISTQCLPERLQHFHDALVDSSAKSAGAGNLKSVRRLMYLHSSGAFVLSPMRADSGVVTVAIPNQSVLENAGRDAFLSTRSRRAIERQLISGHDFNLYAPTNDAIVPEYGPNIGLASHAIRMQHQFSPREFLHLDFWPFYESLRAPRGQLIASPLRPDFGKWRASLGLAWFRKFSLEFTSLWMRSHGTHIKRPHQKLLQLVFGKTALTVHFVHHDDAFEAEVTVGFGNISASGKNIAVHALTKDFVIAMQAVADLGIVSEVDVQVDEGVIVMNFATSAACYKVYIPTCTLDAARNTEHFTHYEPAPLTADESEDYGDDQQEGDFDDAH